MNHRNVQISYRLKISKLCQIKQSLYVEANKFLQSLEEDTVQTKSTIPQSILDSKSPAAIDEKVKCLFMPYFKTENHAMNADLQMRMAKYSNLLKNNQDSSHLQRPELPSNVTLQEKEEILL